MSGPEIQAAAIWSALHGNPLRHAPAWTVWLAIVLAALLSPLLALRLRMRYAVPLSLAAGAAYAGACVVAFDHDLILNAADPLIIFGVSLVATIAAAALAGDIERHLIGVYARVLERTVRERDRQLSATELEIIHRLAHAAESRDTDTGEHVERIGFLCHQLGLAAGMSASDAKMLGVASVMHDVGKIGVPDSVLLKPASLDDDEWVIMRRHTTTGGDILGGSERPIIQMAETIALTHHEHWDGGGYPRGLSGEDIPLVGRICAICDVFDALLSPRPYKEAWTIADALAEIRRSSGSHFDPRLVEVFLELVPDLLHLYAKQAPIAVVQIAGPDPDTTHDGPPTLTAVPEPSVDDGPEELRPTG
jgi:HD-GYP domain-containing protein (c-di-GMP phosphodiesterase class II)